MEGSDEPRPPFLGGNRPPRNNESTASLGENTTWTEASVKTKGYSSKNYGIEVEKMCRSIFVSRAYCGLQLRSVLQDGHISDEDRPLLLQLLEQHQNTWSGLVLIDTLLLSIIASYAISGQTPSDSLTPEEAEVLAAIFAVLSSLATILFLSATCTTLLYILYAPCLTELDDFVWFLCTWHPEAPTQLSLYAAISVYAVFISGSLLTYGIGPLGCCIAGLWAVALVVTFYICMVKLRRSVLTRWASKDWAARHRVATVMATGEASRSGRYLTTRLRQLGVG